MLIANSFDHFYRADDCDQPIPGDDLVTRTILGHRLRAKHDLSGFETRATDLRRDLAEVEDAILHHKSLFAEYDAEIVARRSK